jgi:DegV family protein with EDD domain
MTRTILLTDTTADLPPDVAESLGIHIVPASAAFAEQAYADGSMSAADFYARLARDRERPLPSAPTPDAFEAAFQSLLEDADAIVCLLAPFDVTPTYTNANAAATMLGETGKRIRIVNPGVASLGLASLLVSLASDPGPSAEPQAFLDAIDQRSPRSDTLFVAPDVDWLEEAGHLRRIEERIGEVEDNVPIVRVGSRITGVELREGLPEAIRRMAEQVGRRLVNDEPAIATIAHTAMPDRAKEVQREIEGLLTIERVITTELSPTIGAQLGPGAVGVGVAPLQNGS